MKNRTIRQKNTAPRQHQQADQNIADQTLLGGRPLRYSQPLKTIHPEKDWITSLIWLRVPLLLLGVIGALGLLAQYNQRFAEVSRMVHWPDWWLSVAFLLIAGCVFVLLLIEWLSEKVHKYLRSLQQRKDPGRFCWRWR